MKTTHADDPRQVALPIPDQDAAHNPVPRERRGDAATLPDVPPCPRCNYATARWPETHRGLLYAWCPKCGKMFRLDAERSR